MGMQACRNPDEAMIVAALAHDIERADEKRKIQRSDYDDYDDFKAAHAAASAEILEKILVRCRVDPCVVTRACSLVRMHETGGSPEADILRNADSLSFFEVNLPYYFKREGHDETFRRCVWGYARLSSELKRVCKDFSYSDPDLNRILSSVTAIHRSRHE